MAYRLCGALVALAGTPGAGLAQTSTPIDRDRVDRAQPATPLPTEARPDAPGAAIDVSAGDEAAPPIRNIQFVGTAVPGVVAESAQGFVGSPANRATLQALADAMSRAYARSEVALFTIAIPEQDLSAGNVRILVAEGHIETVVLTGEVEGRSLTLVRRYADRLIGERPTSRRTLERYLSLIQDIPGLRTTSRLEMGAGPGGVRLVLALDYRRPTITAGFDNRTTRLVRDGQLNATARGHGLLREGDDTQISGAAAVDFKDYIYVGATHSTPLGYEGTRLAGSVGYLRTRPRGTALTGEATSFGVTLTHPLIRGYRRNLTLSLGLDGLDSENAAFGSVIATEQTRALRGAAGYSQVSARRALSAGLAVSQGLEILGADIDPTIGDATFLKVNARAGFDQAIGRRAALRLRASGQWARDPLPAIERFAVGGAEFGRAFETAIVSADRGLAGLGEIAFRPIRSGRLAATELYGFGDIAAVRLLPRPGFAGRDFDLASAGGGVRLAWTDRAMIELEYARTLDRPFPGYASDWRFSVSWRLSLRP